MDVILIHRIGVGVYANHSSIMSNEVPTRLMCRTSK